MFAALFWQTIRQVMSTSANPNIVIALAANKASDLRVSINGGSPKRMVYKGTSH